MLSYKIRKCSEKEINEILSKFDQYSFIPNSHICDDNLEDWLKKLSLNADILTCYLSQVLVGTMFFYANDVAVRNKEGFCTYFCILPEYRRYGIASYSLDVVKSFMKKKGITTFRLRCAKSNIAAYNLYLKNGFIVLDEDEEYYTLITQTSVNAGVAEEKNR